MDPSLQAARAPRPAPRKGRTWESGHLGAKIWRRWSGFSRGAGVGGQRPAAAAGSPGSVRGAGGEEGGEGKRQGEGRRRKRGRRREVEGEKGEGLVARSRGPRGLWPGAADKDGRVLKPGAWASFVPWKPLKSPLHSPVRATGTMACSAVGRGRAGRGGDAPFYRCLSSRPAGRLLHGEGLGTTRGARTALMGDRRPM